MAQWFILGPVYVPTKHQSQDIYLAWPFTIIQNNDITISWDFLRLTVSAAMPGHLGYYLSFFNIEPVFLVLRVWLLLVWELQVTK